MKKPNILLLFPDQHRGDWLPYSLEIFKKMGIDKNLKIKMPNIQKLMEHGMTFVNTVSSSPVCAPARACLASGMRYENCGVKNNFFDYDLNVRTFYTALKENNYTVCGVGKFDVHKKTQFWGLDGWVPFLDDMGFTCGIDNAGKFDAAFSGKETPQDPYMKLLHEEGYAENYANDLITRGQSTRPLEIPQHLYCDTWIGKNAVNFINNFEKNKPWFLQVNFTGPHNPWDITTEMKERWENTDFPIPNDFKADDSVDINGIRQNYAAMLENIDAVCGDIIKAVEDRGDLDNTLIIYASDHGEMLGDFNKYGKSIPFRGSIHIPLVVSGLGTKENVISDELVELQDLTSTILDFCDVDSSFACDSISLKNCLLNQEKFPRTCQKSALDEPGRGNWKIVQNHELKVVLYDNEICEIYNIKDDVFQNVNLIKDDNFVKLAKELVIS